MAPTAHDSDPMLKCPKTSKVARVPRATRQSSQDGPRDSGKEGEVYEIKAILDAKRGTTGSVRFLGHSLRINRVLFLFQDKNRLPCQVKRLYRRRE